MKPFLTIQHSSGSCPFYMVDSLGAGIPILRQVLGIRDKNALITSSRLHSLYAKELKHLSAVLHLNSPPLLIPDGEKHKNLNQVEKLCEELATMGLSRHSALIAFGGGVVTDISGFVAGCYMRGISCVYVPTSLLGQIDAALGGKTGVNLQSGKNLVGVFHQPAAVLLCLELLQSLPTTELSCGYAEIIKAAVLADEDFFRSLEEILLPAALPAQLKTTLLGRGDENKLPTIIKRSCEIKAAIVEGDEKESGVGISRALLNLGHTFAHALEAQQAYGDLKHGEAVAIGIGLAAGISHHLGDLSATAYRRIRHLLVAAGLPYGLPANIRIAELAMFIRRDKKKKREKVPLVLLRDLGAAYISEPYSITRIRQLLNAARVAVQ